MLLQPEQTRKCHGKKNKQDVSGYGSLFCSPLMVIHYGIVCTDTAVSSGLLVPCQEQQGSSTSEVFPPVGWGAPRVGQWVLFNPGDPQRKKHMIWLDLAYAIPAARADGSAWNTIYDGGVWCLICIYTTIYLINIYICVCVYVYRDVVDKLLHICMLGTIVVYSILLIH